MSLLDHIDVIPDYPEPGINFYDIQSVLKKPEIWQEIINDLSELAKVANADMIVGMESRGFLVGVPVAQNLGLPFGMVRKKGKLPGNVISQDFQKEYGPVDTLEIQEAMIEQGARVLIMDDLLATAGTMKATGDLVRKAGGEVIAGLVVIDLHELGGAQKLDFPIDAVLQAPLDPFAQKPRLVAE